MGEEQAPLARLRRVDACLARARQELGGVGWHMLRVCRRPAARSAVDESKRDHDLVIPVTAFSESIVAPYRRSRRDGQRAEAALAALGSIVDMTRDIGSRAAQLRATRQIRLPDALILATAIQMAADQILTLDRRWRGVDARVRLLEL